MTPGLHPVSGDAMTTPALHQLLIDTVTHEHDCVLQFDSQRQVLKSWSW